MGRGVLEGEAGLDRAYKSAHLTMSPADMTEANAWLSEVSLPSLRWFALGGSITYGGNQDEEIQGMGKGRYSGLERTR